MANENEAAVRAAFEHGGAAISPETAERFRREMEARGLNASETLAKFGHGTDQQQGSEQPQRMATPPQQQYAPDIGPDGLPRLTAAQVETAAQTLRKFYTGDPAELERALAAAGAKPVTEPGPDTRTDEEREFDASSLAGARPEEYSLDGLWVGRERKDGPYTDLHGLAELDRSLRTALSELSTPKALGRATAEAFADSASAWSKLNAKGDELAVKQYHLEQSALFARVTKVGWQQASEQMKPWLAKMSADTRAFLANSGSLEAAPARVRLWQAYQMAAARAGMRRKP